MDYGLTIGTETVLIIVSIIKYPETVLADGGRNCNNIKFYCLFHTWSIISILYPHH